MQSRFNDGVEFFNTGHFFDAHEAWEDVWRESAELERQWLQGLVQAAVALHHASRGNRIGAASVLARAVGNLEGSPQRLRGIDVRQVQNDLAKVLAELEEGRQLTRFAIRLIKD